MSTVVTIGLDLAKSVFQIHGVEADQGALHPVHHTRSLPDQALAFAIGPLGILLIELPLMPRTVSNSAKTPEHR